MIKLDYRTNNPRWGLSGIHFTNWNEFALALGFFANIRHHKNYGGIAGAGVWNESVAIVIEANDLQGAWFEQGRIYYYGNIVDLQTDFVDLYSCKSAGNSGSTCRMNSNDYVISLIQDFNFRTNNRGTNLTSDVIPPPNAYLLVRAILAGALGSLPIHTNEVIDALNQFDIGWSK